jgi:hypothetical protein
MHGNKRFNQYDLSGEFGICYTRKGEEIYFDLEDYDLIKDHCWYIETGGRVCARNKNNKTPLKMHRIIMHIEDTKTEIDHENHFQWDNRKSNLRVCSHSQNLKNTKIESINTSGYKGVWLRKDTNRYSARIEIDGKRINLGCYATLEEALIARLKAEKEYFGEYSSQKELFEKYNI